MATFPVQRVLTIHGVLFAMAAAATMGCEQSFATPRTSADVPAKKLGLYVEARSNGSTTQVFVELMDKHGLIPTGPEDKLSIAEAGGTEKPFVSLDHRSIAQLSTKSTTFFIILRRGPARYVSTLEMPPPFSLVTYERQDPRDNQVFFDIRWTAANAPTQMLVHCEFGSHQYDPAPLQEGGTEPGMLSIPRRTIMDAQYGASGRAMDGVVVTATRRGGKVVLDPELANYPHAGTLEQIRIVTAMPWHEPQRAVAGDPAP
ncbi:MAG TPA: hypothetical protein PK156_31510 [Polyangium sp.]|nr:hypothetical protein [Polyangium sp.]